MTSALERVHALSCWHGREITARATSDVRDELALGEGRTNQNFIVSCGEERFFVRIGADLPYYGVARVREHAAAGAAAAAGLAPPVKHAEPPDALVTEFVEGRALTEADVREAAASNSPLLAAITDAVRRLHKVPLPSELVPMTVPGWGGPHLAQWLAYAETSGYSRVPVLDGVHELVERLEATARAALPEASPPCFCHFDLLADNFVRLADGGLLIVDFEYSAPGQPLMDLAVLAMGCSLELGEQRRLLSSYLGSEATEEQLRGFMALKVLAALRETFWGVTAELSQSSALSMEEAVSYTDMNFAKFQAALAAFEEG